MSGTIFQDKKYDELDWISQAVEPIESPLNEHLTKIPNEIELDFRLITRFGSDSWNGINFNSLYVIENILNWAGSNGVSTAPLTSCFDIEIIGAPILDFSAKEVVGGKILLKRVKESIDQDALKEILRSSFYSALDIRVRDEEIGRFNEMADLIGCNEAVRSRSPHKKRSLLMRHLLETLVHDTWRIRSHTLAVKVALWISSYINNGDLAALSNFCKFKVMTHNGNAIYSVKETV